MPVDPDSQNAYQSIRDLFAKQPKIQGPARSADMRRVETPSPESCVPRTLQALVRFDVSHKEWESILQTEHQHTGRNQGVSRIVRMEELEGTAKEEEKPQ